MTRINLSSPTTTVPTGGAGGIGDLGVLVAQSNNPTGKPYDSNLDVPVVARGSDGLDRQVTLTRRLYPDGDMRYYVAGVPLGQQFKTEAAARAEVVRRVAAGTLGNLPLAPRQTPAQQTRTVALPGNDGLVQSATEGGKRTLVQLQAKQELRNGRWQVTGYVATKVASFSIESYADSKPRTAYGYPLEIQDRKTLIRAADGGVITDLAQARQRTRELVTSKGLTTTSAAEAQALANARPLPKAIGAMDSSDRVKYLLQETLRQLPASAADELRAMLTSPETWAVMGAFLVAGAIPVLNVPALIVGALLLGNDALDTGGKMVDAVKSALSASSQAELVSASKGMAEALVHSAVMVASPVVGKRVGQAINTSWKASTQADAIALRNFKHNVELRNKGQATDKDVAQAAVLLMQAKRAAAAGDTPTTTTATPSPQTTSTPPTSVEPGSTTADRPAGTSRTPARGTPPDPAAATQRAISKAAEGVFTDPALRTQLAERLAKDPRTNPSKNATASIDPMVVQASAMQLLMPKLLRTVSDGRSITKSAAEAFTARATAWARQESPSNPAGALERLAALPVQRAALVRQTVIDQLTGSSEASMKVLASNQPVAANALSARRQRLADAINSAYPDVQSQAGLLQQNAGNARTALLRQQAGAELGGATPLARAVEAQLKAKGTGERDLVNLSSSPQARISVMKSALVEQWRGSSGTAPLLDGKSQRALRKAIDSQLAGIPGELAKERYLKDLAASGQTMSRLARGESGAGDNLRKLPKEQTTVSERPPSVELANKSAIPSTLKSVPGGFEINVANLTPKQRAHYERLRASDLSPGEINEIASTLMRSGATGLATNPKYLNLSADDLAGLMHLTNGLDSSTALHDVTHVLLTSRKFNYGASEWRENVGNTVANSFIVNPGNAFKPFSWVTGADGRQTLRINPKELAAARAALDARSGRFSDTAFETNFVANSQNRTRAAVERSVFEINYMDGSGIGERYQQFRAQMKSNGQLPDSPAADFEQKLAGGYAGFEARVLQAKGQFSTPDEWNKAIEPIVRVLAEPAIKEYQRVPAATRREMAIDSIASVITAARFNPKVAIPRSREAERFGREWVDMPTAGMKQPGYLKTYLEVRAQVRKAMADDPTP